MHGVVRATKGATDATSMSCDFMLAELSYSEYWGAVLRKDFEGLVRCRWLSCSMRFLPATRSHSLGRFQASHSAPVMLGALAPEHFAMAADPCHMRAPQLSKYCSL